MEAATVYRHGKVFTVKNLGWLLRHWQDVERFEVRAYDGDAPVCECWLIARLRSGGTYETPYASADMLRAFLHRPVFQGLPVNWFGKEKVC